MTLTSVVFLTIAKDTRIAITTASVPATHIHHQIKNPTGIPPHHSPRTPSAKAIYPTILPKKQEPQKPSQSPNTPPTISTPAPIKPKLTLKHTFAYATLMTLGVAVTAMNLLQLERIHFYTNQFTPQCTHWDATTPITGDLNRCFKQYYDCSLNIFHHGIPKCVGTNDPNIHAFFLNNPQLFVHRLMLAGGACAGAICTGTGLVNLVGNPVSITKKITISVGKSIWNCMKATGESLINYYRF
ncbi:MAG TPA: hypothetical protein VEK38_01450 [Candidatus Bathyarchaeia archaeon]|nr:hypothetical protein [Candidatus Bathyarchaeia archaeon]